MELKMVFWKYGPQKSYCILKTRQKLNTSFRLIFKSLILLFHLLPARLVKCWSGVVALTYHFNQLNHPDLTTLKQFQQTKQIRQLQQL